MKVQHFITVLNGVITGQHSGDFAADFFNTPYYGHERIIIPPNVTVSTFDKIEFYDENWNRKSNAYLIDAGLLPMPDGYVRDGDELRRMTSQERIIAGLDEPEEGTKVVDGQIVFMTQVQRIEAGLEELPIGYRISGEEIIPMTQVQRIEAGLEELPYGFKILGDELFPMTSAELLAAGQISQEEFNEHISADNAGELDRRLEELQTPVVIAKAEINAEFAAERKVKIAALLAVMEQKSWPLEVEWPE